MPTSAQLLGGFAAELAFSDIPPDVVRRAKDCIIDTVAAATYGAQFPWARIVVDYALRYGSGGVCSILGFPNVRVHAPYAALANGVLANAYEQDSVSNPTHGVHPGATLLPAVLAACEETNADGKTAIAAFVAGCEVMFRIGAASNHSPEKVGFHAPGIIGPYGAAAAAGRVFNLGAEQLEYALGIAGSLSSGLLAFTKSECGAMVKRLHIGRAAESGILAAGLALEGYTGPETVLEGKFGFLDAYCLEAECKPNLLTADLHKNWKTLCICMKRYSCEKYAHPSVQALRELMTEHGFRGEDVAKVVVEGSERLSSHHNITEPGDIMKGQYSVPFCVALALFRDPDDPKSFDATAIDDPAIRAACRSVEVRARPLDGRSTLATRVTVRLKDGREFARDCDSFKGMPDNPLTSEELRRKFMMLSANTDSTAAAHLFDRLQDIETKPTFSFA